MKIKISDYEIEKLQQYKNKLLLRNNGYDTYIAIILDFVIEKAEDKHKNWFGKEKITKENYLVGYTVMSVNRNEKIKGYLYAESAYTYFPPCILSDYRKAFVNIREDLKILGFDLFDLEATEKYIL